MTVRGCNVRALAGFLVICAIACLVVTYGLMAPRAAVAQTTPTGGEIAAPPNVAERLDRIEKTLDEMKITGEKAEGRTLVSKIMGKQLIALVTWILVALCLIATGFPFVIWLLSRKRILGLSGLSDEVAATILVVEERQAKLANILREIQMEIDYLHSKSAPDLKNLTAQAEQYMEQNRRDLEKAGLVKDETRPVK
jgi:hypothetical protein